MQRPSAECEPVPLPGSPGDWFCWAPPASAKAPTQAELLHQRVGACHPPTGDVSRVPPAPSPSPAMTEALGYMRCGELVPDSTVWGDVSHTPEEICVRSLASWKRGNPNRRLKSGLSSSFDGLGAPFLGRFVREKRGFFARDNLCLPPRPVRFEIADYDCR